MIIDAISDLHGYFPSLKGGDLLLLCGDYTANNTFRQWAEFFEWLDKQNYRKKILIAGNHDGFLESSFPKTEEEAEDLREVREFLDFMGEGEEPTFEYLCDNGTEFEGLKIWGSPWSVWFKGVNPMCQSFMLRESKLQDKFDKIPEDIDILMTHTPPFLILDENIEGASCGSIQLRNQMETRIFPKFHFFGHIHEQGGKGIMLERPCFDMEKNTRCFNVSYLDENYKPMGKIRRIHT